MEHAIDAFREGETVILTLKDKGGLSGVLRLGTGRPEGARDRLLRLPRLQGCCRRRRTCW